MPLRMLLVTILFGVVVSSTSACGPRCLPAHGPVPAPSEARVDEESLARELEADGYSGAKIQRVAPVMEEHLDGTLTPVHEHKDWDGYHTMSPRGPPFLSVIRITLPGAVRVDEPKLFLRRFAHRYARSLAFGIDHAVFVESAPPGGYLLADSFPQRDSGCSFVLLRLEIDSKNPSGSVVISRECPLADKAPPSYRSRALPSTATGAVDVLARGYVVGTGPRESYNGYALDKYGDVYKAAVATHTGSHDYAWEDGNELSEYVRTVPPAEVEQFVADVREADSDATTKPPFEPGELQCRAVVDASSPHTVFLYERSGSATRRATKWLLSVFGG